jgi:hypothetical protein
MFVCKIAMGKQSSIIFFFLLMTGPALGQEFAHGAAAFTHLGASARAIGMGNAYTALAEEDALGMFWNPSSIASNRSSRFSVTDRVIGDSEFGMGGTGSFVSAGGSLPVTNSLAAGFGLMYFGIDGIEQYDNRAQFVGDFSSSEMLFLFTLARIQEPLSIGVNLKYIRQAFSGLSANLAAESAAGLGVDMGFLAHFWRPLRIGFTLKSRVDIERDRVPTSACVGVAYDRLLHIGGMKPRLVLALDLEQIKNRPLRFHLGLGLERLIDYRNFGLSVRVGRNNRMLEQRLGDLLTDSFRNEVEAEDLVGESARWGVGVGINRGGLSLDYTFSRGQLHDPHYVSLAFEY